MEKQKYVEPIVRKGKSKVSIIVCKKAACSGGSSHTATTYMLTNVVTLKKAA